MKDHEASKTDQEIVAMVVGGDKDAFALLVDRYQDKLLRYAYSIVHDNFASSDVVQNSFIKAYVNLNSYNPGLSFSSWVYRIVHNEAINYIKKHRRELTADDENWSSSLPDLTRSVSDEVESKMLSDKAKKIIGQLPIKYREPLVLYYYSNQSYQEISDILKIPVVTVGTRINRAKKRLKSEFVKEGLID